MVPRICPSASYLIYIEKEILFNITMPMIIIKKVYSLHKELTVLVMRCSKHVFHTTVNVHLSI